MKNSILFFLFFLAFYSLYSQLLPTEQGGSKSKTIDFRKPPKSIRYDFEKFNPNYNPLELKERKCIAVEVEKDRRAFRGKEKPNEFEGWLKRKMQSERGLTIKDPLIINLPIVVHVIYSKPEENISNEQIMSQIQVLNEDYQRLNKDTSMTSSRFKSIAAEIGISFKLATHDPFGNITNGIERISISGAPFSEQYINEVIKPNTIWDTKKYLNLWVCNIEKNVLGFSQFPEASQLQGIPQEVGTDNTDGVVINYMAFGTIGTVSPPFNKGRTATHEIGHWLGLRHIWGDGDCDASDYCEDTPNTDGPNFGCNYGKKGCTDVAMVENFMEYTNDSCMNMFSKDQSERIAAVLTNSIRRKEVTQSGTAKPLAKPPVPLFSADIRFGLKGMEVQFTNQSIGENIARRWSFPGGEPVSSTEKNPKVKYPKGGSFHVFLETSNEFGADKRTSMNYIRIYEKGEKLPFSIDFETEDIHTDIEASLVIQENGWIKANTLGGYGESSGAFWVNNYSNNRLGTRSSFILPMLDFSTGVNTLLQFDKAYKSYNSTYTDTLGIYISTDGGKHFHAVYYKFGKQLSPFSTSNLFSPLPSDWETEKIDLTEYDGMQQVMLAFVNFSGYGNNLFVDNIKVSSAPLPLPEVDFALSKTEICAGDSIKIKDLTKYKPEKWRWTFSGADISGDTTQSPIVRYSQPGTYTITLNAINSSGEGSKTKTAAIIVKSQPSIDISGVPTESICPSTIISLSAFGASNLNWSYRDVNINQAFFTDTLYHTTTFLVSGLGANGCSAQKSILIEAKDEKDIKINPQSANICVGDSRILTVTGGKSYNWLPANGLIQKNTPAVEVRPTQNTQYTVFVGTENGCTIEKKVELKVYPRPKLQVSSDKTSICKGEKVLLQASGAATYFWGNGQSGKKLSFSPASNTQMKLIGLNEYGCEDSISTSITVHPPLIVSINPSITKACEGTPITLNAIGNASNFQWISPSKGLLSSNSSLTISTKSSETYSLAIESEQNCKDTILIPVSILPKKQITVTANNYAFCKGESIVLTAEGAKEFEWTNKMGETRKGASLTVSPTQTSQYTVMGIDENNCASHKTSITLAALDNSAPRADFEIKNLGKICAGEKVKFLDLSRNAKRYYWEFPGANITKSTSPNPEVIYPKGGSYGVFLHITGCNGIDSLYKADYVFIEESPTLSIESDKKTVCEGDEVLLSASANGAVSYSWFPTLYLNKASGDEVITSPKDSITYHVLAKNKEGCTSKTSIHIPVLQNKEELIIEPAFPVVCIGDTLALSAKNGFDHEWHFSDSKKIRVNKFVEIAPQVPVWVKVSAKNDVGCPIIAEFEIKTLPRLSIQAKPQNITLCKGSNARLEVTGNASFNWSPEVGLNDYAGKIVEASPLQSQIYTVTGTDENGCTASANVNVQVSDSKPVTLKIENGHICKGSATLIIADHGGNYKWLPRYGITEEKAAYIIVSPEQTTTYTVRSINEDGCESQANTTVFVHQLPGIRVLPLSGEICLGDSIQIKAETQYPSRWGEEVPARFAAEKSFFARPTQTNVYTINAWDENGCLRTGSTTISVKKNQNARISAPQTAVCEGNTITLEAKGGNEYQWLMPSGKTTSGARLTVSPEKNETFKVVVKDKEGCKDTATFAINARMLVPQISISQWDIDLANEKGLISFEDKTTDASFWQWDFGDGGTSDLRNPKHVYTQVGDYTAKLTVSNGLCSQSINKKIHIFDSSNLSEVETNGSLLTEVKPNGLLNFEFTISTDMTFQASIFNDKQEELISGIIKAKQGVNTHSIDLSDLPKGNYVLQLTDKVNKMEKKVVWR